MANFPPFNDINDLRNLLSQQNLQDLNQVGDDGKTYFAQIVDHIHQNLSAGIIELESILLTDFVNLIVDNDHFDFAANNQVDAQGFTPLGHLFKNFTDQKVAKTVFRALISKNVEIDWYQNSKLNAHNNLTGPVLVQVLTQTHTTNAIKRINECIEKNILVDFDLLVATDPAAVMMAGGVVNGHMGLSFSRHLDNVLNANGLSINALHNMLHISNQVSNIEHYLSAIISRNPHSAQTIIDTSNTFGLKVDAHKLPLQQIFSLMNLHNVIEIERVVQTFKSLHSIHSEEAEVLDINHLFDIPEGQNPIPAGMMHGGGAMMPPNGPSLINHMFQSIMPHNGKQAALEVVQTLTRLEIELDLNVKDGQGFSGWQHLASKIFSNNGAAPGNPSLKKIFKDFMKLKSIPKEELVSLFMNFMPISDVIDIAEKHNHVIAFNKPFNANIVVVGQAGNMMPQTNSWIGMPARETSLIDMLFSLWSQPGHGIRDLSIIKKMQAIDETLDLTHIYKNTMPAGGVAMAGAALQEFGLLDCIAIDGPNTSLVKIVRDIEEASIELTMLPSYAKKFAAVAKFPSAFKQITALRMFKEADPKIIATFLLNVQADDFLNCLETLLKEEVAIDFSNDMHQLVSFIEGNIQQQQPNMHAPMNGMPAVHVVHHKHTLVALDKMLQALISKDVTLADNKTLITPQIIDMRSFEEAIEILNIISTYEETFPCQLNNIALNVWNNHQAQGATQKEVILDALKLFKVTKLHSEEFFGKASHNDIKSDFDLFISKFAELDLIATYQHLLKHTNNLKQALDFLVQHVNPDIGTIKDEEGNTAWHWAVDNTSYIINEHVHPLVSEGIKFNLANNSGETVFARMVEHQHPFLLNTILNQAWNLIEQQNVDVNQKTTDGDFALIKIAMDGHHASNSLLLLTNRCKASGEPWFNINQINNAGDRVIDVVARHLKNGAVTIHIINSLRECGSVEPKTPICKGIEFKVDVSEGRLEGYGNNKQNALKLVDLLYTQYPLSDAEIDDTINAFKLRNFANKVGEIEWKTNEAYVDSIPKVIDAITGVYASGYSMGRAAAIGFNDPTRGNQWTTHNVDCKKVIGTMIHMVNQNPDLLVTHPYTGEMRLEDLFIYCLTSLKACVPGKLVNLMSVAQEALSAGVGEIDYAHEDFTPQCVQLTSQLFEGTLAKFPHLPQKAVIQWIYDMTTNIDHPENWAGSTQVMHGILNHSIITRGISRDNMSYHFKKILDLRMLQFAHQINPSEYEEDVLALGTNPAWIQAARDGVTELAREFCIKVIASPEPMEELFEDSAARADIAFGDFSIVGRDVFLEAATELPQEKVAKFLVLLIDNFALGDDVLRVLSERLIAQTSSNPDELADALESNWSVIQTIDASDEAINVLIGFIKEKQLVKTLTYMSKWLYNSLVVDDLVPEIITDQAIETALTTNGLFEEILQAAREAIEEEARDDLLAAGIAVAPPADDA